MAATVLGVDLGCTTGSCAVCKQGVVDVVPNEQGSRVTPAVVAFTDVETLLGEAARGQQARNPTNTIVQGLRLLGREMEEEALQAELKAWRFRVSRAKDGKSPQVDVHIKGESKSLAIPRLLSHLLARLRADAEAYSGESVKEAVLVVPAHFSPAQRDALREAAQIAAMRVKMVLPAPLCVAALYAHGIPLSGEAEGEGEGEATRVRQLLVVDIGGSSSEASIVEYCTGSPQAPAEGGGKGGEGEGEGGRRVSEELSVRASVHARGSCGDSVDRALQQHVLKEIKRRQRADLSDNSRALSRLLAACQAAKHSLTGAAQAQVTVEADGVDYFCNVSRATMEELSASVAREAAALAERALEAAGLPAERVDALLLAGGGCRMPRVQAALTALCPRATVQHAPISEEAACRGAALCGAMLRPMPRNAPGSVHGGGAGGEVTSALFSRPRLPHGLAIRTAGGGAIPIAERGSAVPLSRSVRFGCASASAPLLLSLIETNKDDPMVDVSDAAVAPADAHTVASVPIRELPAGTEALVVRVNVESSGGVEVQCEAELAAGEGEERPGRKLVATVRV